MSTPDLSFIISTPGTEANFVCCEGLKLILAFLLNFLTTCSFNIYDAIARVTQDLVNSAKDFFLQPSFLLFFLVDHLVDRDEVLGIGRGQAEPDRACFFGYALRPDFFT
jgi:hypothetical protein